MRFYLKNTKRILKSLGRNLDLFLSNKRYDFRPVLLYSINKIRKPRNLNIGSGSRLWLGWTLIDEIVQKNILNIDLSKGKKLPFEDASFDLIYTSHFLEHVSESTVNHVLLESSRVISNKGFLVIKLPNFDGIVKEFTFDQRPITAAYRNADICTTWSNFGVTDNLDNVASMVFAGFYTKNYGDHFTNPTNLNLAQGYHGPARVSEDFLKSTFSCNDPEKISKVLSEQILSDPIFYRFNHQGSWSKDKFISIVENVGFKLVKVQGSLSNSLRKKIPDFDSMLDISNLFVFRINRI